MKESISKDFIFTENSDGSLSFSGEFDEYYQNVSDPWQQSGKGDDANYYFESRSRLVNIINRKKAVSVLEVGCGLGYVCNLIASKTGCIIDGWDISLTAIERAKEQFKEHNFVQVDISKPLQSELIKQSKYDVVILNQLLWYILPELQVAIENCMSILAPGGYLVISNAFARDQRFGKEYINGFDGAFNYFNSLKSHILLFHAEFNDDGFRNLDGLFILKRNLELQSQG